MLSPDLTDVTALKRLLTIKGITPKRSAGQNFLVAAEVVEAILAAARAGPRHITELGAGLGTLTQALLAAGFQVRAIEQDRALATLLPKFIPTKQRANLNLHQVDLRHTDWTWEHPYQLLGNIPYNLSGLIIRRLAQLEPAPAQAILLLQQEVGQCLTATVPHMHLISLAVQLWGKAQLLLNVPRHSFWPPPQVNSQLLLLTPHPKTLPLAKREAILQTAKKFFQHRRKQMGQAVISLNLPPTVRPQELSVTQWQALHDIL